MPASLGYINPNTLPRIKRTSGYSQADVLAFLAKGDTLGKGNGRSGPDAFNPEKDSPVMKTRTDLQSLWTGQTIMSSGFTGQFSDKTTEQLEGIMEAFTRRKEVIRARAAAPGMSQLFFSGR